MKKSIILVCFTIISIYTSAAYYVAGNGTSGNPWCDGAEVHFRVIDTTLYVDHINRKNN